jgi:hypothetical protein
MEPNIITVTIKLVENESHDIELANKDRVAEDILVHLSKLPHNALLNVNTYDFIKQHHHQEFRVKHY